MRKAYLNASAKHKENSKSDMLLNGGSASAMVINGEKLVVAQMGDHKVVVCREGVAHQLRSRHQHKEKKHWPRRLISGMRQRLLCFIVCNDVYPLENMAFGGGNIVRVEMCVPKFKRSKCLT